MDCVEKDDHISIEEFCLGISFLLSKKKKYFVPEDFKKISPLKDEFGMNEFFNYCFKTKLVTVSE